MEVLLALAVQCNVVAAVRSFIGAAPVDNRVAAPDGDRAAREDELARVVVALPGERVDLLVLGGWDLEAAVGGWPMSREDPAAAGRSSHDLALACGAARWEKFVLDVEALRNRCGRSFKRGFLQLFVRTLGSKC